MVLLPLWLQQFMGYTATDAGMILAPVGLLAMVFSPIVGKTIGQVDPRRYATFAFIVFALVLWMRSRFNTQADFTTIMIPTILQGAGDGVLLHSADHHHLVRACRPERIPAASGLTNFARITAGAFGTSISTTLWESRAALHHAQLAEAVQPGQPGGAGHAVGAVGVGAFTPSSRWPWSIAWWTSRRSCWRPTTSSTSRR